MKLAFEGARVLDWDSENTPLFYWYDGISTDFLHTLAWSFLDEEFIESTQIAWQGSGRGMDWDPDQLEHFVEVIESADIHTGHNILRHDIPLLNATMIRYGMRPIKWPMAVDTLQQLKNMKLKGIPKGQEYLADHFEAGERKMHVGLHTWELAARGQADACFIVRERCESDVESHKELYVALNGGTDG